MAAGNQPQETFGWADDSIELSIEVDRAGMARIARLAAPAPTSPRQVAASRQAAGPAPGPATEPAPGPATGPSAGLPLVDVVLAGEGRSWSGSRYCESVTGARLRYVGHEDAADSPGWQLIRVDLRDPASGLRAEVFYRILTGRGALRSWVRLSNAGAAPLTVQSVTSLLCGGLTVEPGRAGDGFGDLDVLWGENDWLAENRWQRRPLSDALPDLSRRTHGADPRGSFGVTSTGTWSSGLRLPMGGLASRDTGQAWVWQVEHNGAWHWQVGEHTRREKTAGIGHGAVAGVRRAAYMAVLGPTDTEHDWHVTLAPGDSFTTVPAAIAVGAAGLDDALGRLTGYRRAIRRPHPDHGRLSVIFNDYMNTLLGDPSTERLLPLITAAGSAGAEYFCIDAGWYADPGVGWWDSVGAWKPSASRFAGGLGEVLDRIRAAGMVPGLWLEPEVIGVHSPVAQLLPAAAFFTRHGQRVVEHGRYHLDLRHRAAVKHLNEAIDFLVEDLGVGYLKLDYNINGGPGTDAGGLSAGAGLLAHNRAHLDWLDAVLDRHPSLVIENCASGGMRMDYALLSRLQVQSTSDQQAFLRYPPISAAAPAAVTPEQAASWAYPQPSFSDREIAFTVCGALLGRIHLSGHIDQMTSAQLRLVAEAVTVYKDVRFDLPGAVPFWPLGLPSWDDSWLALGMRGPSRSYLLAWHRGPVDTAASTTVPPEPDPDALELSLPHLRGERLDPQVLYPQAAVGAATWAADSGQLTVRLPDAPAACLIRLAR
ncbi:MAG TPA: glycoside hydrolase family 36 protein [Trebonia sp.]|nr:glycoside hydrolase family 36 protein [Trebonia sp.]